MMKRGSAVKIPTSAPIHHAIARFKEYCSFETEESVEIATGHIIVYYNVIVKKDWNGIAAGTRWMDVQYLPKQKIFHLNQNNKMKNFRAMRLRWDAGEISEGYNKESDMATVWWEAADFNENHPHYYYKLISEEEAKAEEEISVSSCV